MINTFFPKKKQQTNLSYFAQLNVNIIIDGDSLSVDTTTSWQNYFFDLIDPKCKYYTFSNYSVGGRKMETILANESSNVYTKIDPAKTNIIILWEDVNSLFGANPDFTTITPAQLLVLQKDYIDNAYTYAASISAPLKIIVLNSYYMSGNHSQQDKQKMFFDLSVAAGYGDTHVDLRDIAHLGGDLYNDHIGQDSYFIDYVHYTALGAPIVANAIFQGLSKIFDTTGTPSYVSSIPVTTSLTPVSFETLHNLYTPVANSYRITTPNILGSGVATKRLIADGFVQIDYNAGIYEWAASNFALCINSTHTPPAINSLEVAFYGCDISANVQNPYYGMGKTASSPYYGQIAVMPIIGDKLRIRRTGKYFYEEYSRDGGTTWITIYKYLFTSIDPVYIMIVTYNQYYVMQGIKGIGIELL